ncbi:MAG: DUF1573 domain-containing protein [Bacteroidales bacterium]|jgi:hypothetical protein|nr:DUF1573 domain-containing protein [Bacteroidales bacterium]
MKKIFLIFIVLSGAIRALGQEPQPSVFFLPESKVHDFGSVQEKKGRVSHSFHLKNTGTGPIVINNISAWCGCTETDYTRDTILPGKTGFVTVTFNPYGRSGFFSKEILVLFNDCKNYTRLWVKGTVVPYQHPVTEDFPYSYGSGIYMSHKILAFTSLKKGQSQTMQLRVANDNDRPVTILFKRESRKEKILQMPFKLVLKARQRVKLDVVFTAPSENVDNRYIMVYPVAGGKKLMPLKITWLPERK